jgi:predicted dehydrogenase
VKALFVGLGGVGQRHLRNLRRLRPDAELLAVRTRGRSFEIKDDLTPDHGVDIVKKYAIRVFGRIEDAAKAMPDFAIVSNPTSLHVETTCGLLKRGIPVLLEKPISDSEEGLDELVELSRKKGVPVMVGYMMRFHPSAERMEGLLKAQAIGPVHSAVLISHSYVPSWHNYEQPKEFYAGSRSLGGGAVLTEIHELDLLHWYFGAPRRLWALGGKMSALGLDVEDTASSLLEFEQGGRCFPVSVNVSFAQTVPLRRFMVFGERGRIQWDILADRIAVEDHARGLNDVFEVPGFQRNDLFVRELEHFLDCLATKQEPKTALPLVLAGHCTALKIRAAVLPKEVRP